jgi:cytochrome c oxidase assembly protein subunit 15
VESESSRIRIGALPGLRARLRHVSPQTFRQLAFLALAALGLVVATGAVVRLTASGLGCDNWPRCGDTPFPEKDFHALVEFGNRVVALLAMLCTIVAALAARRVAGLPRRLVWASAAVAISILAQIPLGGLTVILDLHPLAVMSHFLLAMLTVCLATAVALGAHSFAHSTPTRSLPRLLTLLSVALVPVALIVVVTGAFVTAAGPHSGGDDIDRLGNLEDAVYVHVRATAVFGIAFLLLAGWLLVKRRMLGLELRLAAAVLALVLGQVAVGEIQWRSELPWWLVLVHVGLATCVLAGIVAIAVRLLQRRPA